MNDEIFINQSLNNLNMKTLKFYAFIGTVLAAFILLGCAKEDDLTQTDSTQQNLSGQELDGLISLVEKQKLHRDVYLTLFNATNKPLFNELYQTDENMYMLLTDQIEDYGFKNPVLYFGIGEFRNPDIQNVYDDFQTAISSGIYQALEFAILMEESNAEEVNQYLGCIEDCQEIFCLCTDLLKVSYDQIEILESEMEEMINAAPDNPINET